MCNLNFINIIESIIIIIFIIYYLFFYFTAKTFTDFIPNYNKSFNIKNKTIDNSKIKPKNNKINNNDNLTEQLNNEKIKNEKLEYEIQKLKNECKNQINELNLLKNNIQQLKIENENIKNENNKLKLLLNNKQNNEININEINKLKQIIIEKDNEIIELKLKKIEKKKVYVDDILVINFASIDQSVRTGISCLPDDTFAEVEEKLYQTYDEFRDTNNIFWFKGNIILRFKKIKENNIKNGDTILFDKQEINNNN